MYAINAFNAELIRFLLMKPTISFDVKNHAQKILCNTGNFIMECGHPVKMEQGSGEVRKMTFHSVFGYVIGPSEGCKIFQVK